MKRSVYKICIAGAIVALFLLSSITAAGLATTSGGEQLAIQIKNLLKDEKEEEKFIPPSDEQWLNDTLNNLPEVTEDMDGKYEDPAYPVPDEWGWDEDETLDTDPDALMNVLGIFSPNLKITKIKIHRGLLGATFTVRVRDIRPLIPVFKWTRTLVVVTKLGLPIHFRKHLTRPLIRPLAKCDIDVTAPLGVPFPWTFTGGGSVIAWPDCNNVYDEGFGENLGLFGKYWDWKQDHDIRIRHFWSNLNPIGSLPVSQPTEDVSQSSVDISSKSKVDLSQSSVDILQSTSRDTEKLELKQLKTIN